MDSEPDPSIALLSIHPEYVELIATGEKKVEFRRIRFQRHLTHIVVYSTSPEKRLVGYFEVEDMEVDSPELISSKYEANGGVSPETLSKYMKDATHAVAIIIGNFYSFSKHIDLNDIGIVSPPQSFRYLDQGIFEYLQSYV